MTTRHSLLTEGEILGGSVTLCVLAERIATISQSVPHDTKLKRWFNPSYLRDELIFATGPGLQEMTVDQLVAEETPESNEEILRRARRYKVNG